jgi:hypothetical protein
MHGGRVELRLNPGIDFIWLNSDIELELDETVDE